MSRRRRPAWAPLLVAVATALATPCFVEAPARAAGEANADAKAAWEKGKTLARQKKWDAAADAFREASVMSPDPQYKLDLARALLSADKPSEASRALDEIDAAKDVSPGVRGAAAKAREQAEKKLATIAVTVTGGGGRAVIEIDGKRVKSGDANRVDPGKHQIRAQADGWIPIEMTLEVAAGKTESVPFKLEPDPSAGAEPDEAPAEETAPPEEGGGGTLLPAAVAWGVSAVGFGVGTIFGIFAFDEADKARTNCEGDRCTEEARDAIGTSKVNGGISTVGFAVGGAALVTGIVLAVVYGSGDSAPETGAALGPTRVTPWIGGTSAGIDGSF